MLHVPTSSNEFACPACAGDVQHHLSGELHGCQTCGGLWHNCPECRALQTPFARNCDQCGEKLTVEARNLCVNVERFQNSPPRQIEAKALWKANLFDTHGDRCHLDLLHGTSYVWLEKLGIVRAVSQLGAIGITANDVSTPNMLGPPSSFRPDGALYETGRWVVQVGRQKVLVWPTTSLTNARWSMSPSRRAPPASRTAAELGFERFIPVYAWIADDLILLAGQKPGVPSEFGVRVARVARDADGHRLTPEGSAPVWGMLAGTSLGEWSCNAWIVPAGRPSTVVATYGPLLWRVRVDGSSNIEIDGYTYNSDGRSPAPSRTEVNVSLNNDQNYFVVQVDRLGSGGAPRRTAEQWSLGNENTIRSQPLHGGDLVSSIGAVRALGPLVAIAFASLDGATRMYQFADLQPTSPWSLAFSPDTAEVRRVAIGPDYVCCIGTFARKTLLGIAPIAAGRHAFVFTAVELGDIDDANVEMVACTSNIVVFVAATSGSKVYSFALINVGV